MTSRNMTETLRSKLNTMTAKLAALEKTVAQEAFHKRAMEEQRVQKEAARVTDVEAQLSQEIKARVESSRDLQSTFEVLLSEKATVFQDIITRSLNASMGTLEDLSRRLDVFDASLTSDFSPTHSPTSLLLVQDHLDDLKKNTTKLREEFENTLLPDVDDSLKRCVRELRELRRRLNATVEKDIADFQEALAHIRERCHHTNQEADESNTTYKIFIPQEIDAFKQAIKQESITREETDDAMVQALNEYNIALRKGFSTTVVP